MAKKRHKNDIIKISEINDKMNEAVILTAIVEKKIIEVDNIIIIFMKLEDETGNIQTMSAEYKDRYDGLFEDLDVGKFYAFKGHLITINKKDNKGFIELVGENTLKENNILNNEIFLITSINIRLLNKNKESVE